MSKPTTYVSFIIPIRNTYLGSLKLLTGVLQVHMRYVLSIMQCILF